MNSIDSRLQTKVRLLTIHALLHTLNKTVNDPRGLSYGSPSLVLHELVRRLQDRLDVLVPEEFFSLDIWLRCAEYGDVSARTDWTHSTVAAWALRSPKDEGRDQLYYYLDHHINHCGRERDLRVYIDTTDRVLV